MRKPVSVPLVRSSRPAPRKGSVKSRIQFRRKFSTRDTKGGSNRGTTEWYAERDEQRKQATAAWEERVRKALLRKAAEAAGKRYVPERVRSRKVRATYQRFKQFTTILSKAGPAWVVAGALAARRVRRLRSYLRRRARVLIKMRRFQVFKRPVITLGGKLRVLSGKQRICSLSAAVSQQTVVATPKPVPGPINFVTKGARQIYRAHQRATISARLNRREWERPFDEHRGQLWNDLTLR